MVTRCHQHFGCATVQYNDRVVDILLCVGDGDEKLVCVLEDGVFYFPERLVFS